MAYLKVSTSVISLSGWEFSSDSCCSIIVVHIVKRENEIKSVGSLHPCSWKKTGILHLFIKSLLFLQIHDESSQLWILDFFERISLRLGFHGYTLGVFLLVSGKWLRFASTLRLYRWACSEEEETNTSCMDSRSSGRETFSYTLLDQYSVSVGYVISIVKHWPLRYDSHRYTVYFIKCFKCLLKHLVLKTLVANWLIYSHQHPT